MEKVTLAILDFKRNLKGWTIFFGFHNNHVEVKKGILDFKRNLIAGGKRDLEIFEFLKIFVIWKGEFVF